MGLETGTLISDLVTTNPAGGDPLSQGDDHIRLLKTVIKTDAVSQAQLAAKQDADATLTGLAALSTTQGFLCQTATDTFNKRNINGTASRINVSNNNGSGGSPVINIAPEYDAIVAAKEPALPAGGDTSNFLRGDKTWAVPAGGGGSGDVVGPASTVDNTVPRFDTTTGKLIQSSNMALQDDGTFAITSGANTVVSYTTSGTSSSGGLVIAAMPPHGQYLSITPRSDSNGALVLNSGGGFNFDSALSIGSGSAVSNTVSLSRQTSGATHALKVGSGLINLPHGSAPSAPTNGDLWTTTAGAFWRVNGATRQVATNITVASTAPSSPAVNDVWIDTT